MQKRMIAAFVIAIAIVFTSVAAYGQGASDWSSMNNVLSDLGLSRADLDIIKDAIDNRSLPVVSNVAVFPEEPGADEPVIITADIATPHKPSGDEIWEANIFYSSDGGKTVAKIEMERKMESNGKWEGAIPGQPSGTNLSFGIQAINTYGGTYIEALCEVDGSLDESRQRETEDCSEDKTPELCNAKSYAGCAVPMSFSEDRFGDYADASGKIKDDLFIKTTRASFNEKNLILQINTKGNVTPGSFSPAYIHIYVAGWLNPDKLSNEMGIDAILKQGAIIIYAPLNISKKCALYYVYGVDVQSDSRAVSCLSGGDYLTLTVDRNAMEPNPSKTLEFLFMTFSMTQISPSEVDLQDITLFTKVFFGNRSIQVR